MSTWVEQVLPLAQRASAGTGLPVSSILTQWALETGFGTSALAKKNNLSGINFTGQPGSRTEDGRHAIYDSPDDFLRDYIRVVNLSFYSHVRAAAPRGPEAVLKAWTESPPGVPRYAEDPAYSAKLLEIWRSQNLARFDGQQAPQGAISLPGVPGVQVKQEGGSTTILHPAGLAVGAALLLGLAVVIGSRD